MVALAELLAKLALLAVTLQCAGNEVAAALIAAEACAGRWRYAGREAWAIAPAEEGQDFAGLLSAREVAA